MSRRVLQKWFTGLGRGLQWGDGLAALALALLVLGGLAREVEAEGGGAGEVIAQLSVEVRMARASGWADTLIHAGRPGEEAEWIRGGLEAVLAAPGLGLDQEVRVQLVLAGLDEVLWRAEGEPAAEEEAPRGSRRVVRRVQALEAAEAVPERRLARVEAVPERRLARVEAVEDRPRGVRRVEARETGEGERRGGRERWQMPVESPRLTSGFGPRIHPITGERGRMHNGVDFGAPSGTAVHASASGTVLLAGWCGNGPGNCVVIDHGGGWRSHYFHLSRWRVRAGQSVRQGDRIGDVGSTGSSTGPHLHYESRIEGRAVDPAGLWGRPVGSR